MAATNSTSNLGLPQWVATDKPERTDFNTAMSDIDNTFAAHLADTTPHPEEVLSTFSALNNALSAATSPARDTWYQAPGWSLTVPPGTYRVDLHTIIDGGLTSAGIVIPHVQLGTSLTPGSSLLGFSAVGALMNYTIAPSSWADIFMSQVFTFEATTTIYVNYRLSTITGTPTVDAVRLRNNFPVSNNGLLRATEIKKVA